jgi:CubicO group peptidase (beta-lactamase class C family)
MKKNPHFSIVVLAVIIHVATCISLKAHAQTEQVDTLIRREMQERRIPGIQLAVVRHGKIVLLRAYGIANVEDSVPVTNRSIFAINSCTKSFTGVAIMQLVEEGKVELSAPVSRYLDSLPVAWQPVTIRQLLTHVSGLPDINKVLTVTTGGPGDALLEKETWTKVRALPMDFPTGEQFAYNQTNYALLGKIIDKFRGIPFTEVFRERQFEVAGMTNTGFGDSHDVIPHNAPTYRWSRTMYGQPIDRERLVNNFEEFLPFRRSASGMKSTAEDVARWIIALQSGRILRTKTALDTLWTAGSYNNGKPTQWALGCVFKPRPGHPALEMTGGGRSVYCVYPKDDLAIVILTNLSGGFPEEFLDEVAGCFDPTIPESDPVTKLKIELRKRGFEHAIDFYNDEKKSNPNFQPSEDDLNDWAYRMLSIGQKKQALEIFKLNVYLYPLSWNAYDSYGESLLKNGRKEEAIKMYQKSVELNPENNNGKKALERLLKDKSSY